MCGVWSAPAAGEFAVRTAAGMAVATVQELVSDADIEVTFCCLGDADLDISKTLLR
jgi:hypothetical protein